MKKIFLNLFLGLSLVAAVNAQTAVKPNQAARQAADAITAEQLKDYLYFVASDEMEGRDTPSRGLDLTAKFLATMMARWGVKPAGDNNTYFQKIALVRGGLDSSGSGLEIDGQKLTYGTDFLADAKSPISPNAGLVFGGNGWLVKSKNIDALKDLDVRGKIVVVYTDNLPRGVTFQDLSASGNRGEGWADPATYAKQKGAVGLVVVATPNAQNNWERLRAQRERGNLSVERLRESTDAERVPTIYLSRQAAEVLFRGETTDLAKITASDETNSLATFSFNSNKRFNFTSATKNETVYTQNVVGLIEGSDPQLKSEMIAIGAHYDHVGVNQNAPGDDKIWNGADDDGSGTVAMLAIAEALAKSPRKPKRSVLLVWHAGEEKGLWGSEYFTQFPTVPLDKIVAQLNIDMIGRSKRDGDTDPRNKDLSGANEVYVIGSKMMSTELGNLSEAVNNSYLKLGYNYRYDDPKDPNRFFFRSDHFNYARKGVPIIFYFDGVHEDYHRPGDHPDKIDYDKMQKITRTIFMTMWEIGDARTRPAVDKQLPAELLQR